MADIDVMDKVEAILAEIQANQLGINLQQKKIEEKCAKLRNRGRLPPPVLDLKQKMEEVVPLLAGEEPMREAFPSLSAAFTSPQRICPNVEFLEELPVFEDDLLRSTMADDMAEASLVQWEASLALIEDNTANLLVNQIALKNSFKVMCQRVASLEQKMRNKGMFKDWERPHAQQVFDKMPLSRALPEISSLDAVQVRQVHAPVVKSGFGSNPPISNGLLAVYAKSSGDADAAPKLFDEMSASRMVCSWTLLIAGYTRSGRANEALMLFIKMLMEGVKPESDTMVSVLSACSSLESRDMEKWATALSEYNSNADNLLGEPMDTAIISLYGKCDKVEKSRYVFDRMTEKGRASSNAVAWNAMISGYVQDGQPLEALNLFHRMLASLAPKPNHVTIVSVLTACSLVRDLELGRWAYRYMKIEGREGFILAPAFIDMYFKCGGLEEAKSVFYRMAVRDVVSYYTMITGLAMSGRGPEALKLFSEMEILRIQPNDGTFLSLLCPCTHSGLVSQSRVIVRDMQQKYSITPQIEHYTSFIHVLALSGLIEEALEVVDTMPMEPNSLVWGALLGACLVHSRIDIAHDVTERLLDVDPVETLGLSTRIVTQPHFDHCPLVAICNALLLRNAIILDPFTKEVSRQELINHVGLAVLHYSGKEQTTNVCLIKVKNLAYKLNMAVHFTKINDFEYRPEPEIFDLLDVGPYHGWVVDPQATEIAAVIGLKPHNTLIAELSAFHARRFNGERNGNFQGNSHRVYSVAAIVSRSGT